MTRYIGDTNKVVFQYESGTYAVSSGAASTAQWIGQVEDNSFDENESKIVGRFMGTATRSYDTIELGPTEYTGTLTYAPNDMRFVFWAIGSINETTGTGTANIHYANQINHGNWLSPFISGTGQISCPSSFTIEDSKTAPGTNKNFVRTIKGCVVNSARVIASQGEKVKCEVDYVAQNVVLTSGTTLSVTTNTNTPYLWNNCTLTASGNVIQTAKEVTLEINNNIEGPHYVNGSRVIGVPILGNRDVTLDVTMDLNSNDAGVLYDLFKNNAVFNTTFDLNGDRTAGSLHTIFFLSGCKINSMENPSTVEGPTESSINIMAQSIVGSAIDTVSKYNAW
jgi:hypothetical protein